MRSTGLSNDLFHSQGDKAHETLQSDRSLDSARMAFRIILARLCKNQYEFKHFVKDVFVLPKIHDLILEGPGQTSVYKKKRPVFSGCPVFNRLALKIDFS